MSEDSILMCLIAFVLGYFVASMMRGNGLMVGSITKDDCTNIGEICGYLNGMASVCPHPTASGDPLCPKEREFCRNAFNLYMNNC